MKKVRDTTLAKDFTYINPEDGHIIKLPTYVQTKNAARDYRKWNNYPIGSAWNDQFEANTCKNTPGDVCVDFTPPTLAERLETLAKALAAAAADGFSVAPSAEVERRHAICKECNYYGGQRGLFKLACKKCGCSGLKLHLQSSHCPANRWG
jgi:hypothetical protein